MTGPAGISPSLIGCSESLRVISTAVSLLSSFRLVLGFGGVWGKRASLNDE